jgi:hypothetical protein
MYEYWFLGLTDEQGNCDETGTTYDFLQVVANVGGTFGPVIAGHFIAALVEAKLEQLNFLRVTDWKFEYRTGVGEQTIKLNYTPR